MTRPFQFYPELNYNFSSILAPIKFSIETRQNQEE